MASQQVVMSLAERLDKIRSPKLQNQKEVRPFALDSLREQLHNSLTPLDSYSPVCR